MVIRVDSDPETEPESSTAPTVDWPASTGSNRPDGITKYLVNQTNGHQANCHMILERDPDLDMVVGDRVEACGEQREGEKYGRHNEMEKS